MPRGHPRLQKRLWWQITAKGQLILFCRKLALPLIQDFSTKEVRCIIGNVELYSPNDLTIVVIQNGKEIKEISGFKTRLYLTDERTLVIESGDKRYTLRFKKPLVQTSE